MKTTLLRCVLTLTLITAITHLTTASKTSVPDEDLTATVTPTDDNACASAFFAPTITNIMRTPLDPDADDTVSVSAEVDASFGRALISVSLNWGMNPNGPYPNNITMNNAGGGVYTTTTDIPAHAAGTTIYYVVEATDAALLTLNQTTTSAERQYTVINSPTSITNIATTPAEPITGETVSVSADVVDVDGLSNVTLNWGTTMGGPYPMENDINMTLGVGDSYTTDTDIPSQDAGTIVYYTITATDTGMVETSTAEQSYTVADIADYVYRTIGGWTPNDPSGPVNPSGINSSVVVVDGTAIVLDDFVANSVVVNSGATLTANGINLTETTGTLVNNGTVTIAGVLEGIEVNITTGDAFTFLNDDTVTGIIGLSEGTTYSGKVTVERYIPSAPVTGNRAFRLLASPLKNAGTINANWQEGQSNTGSAITDNMNTNPTFGLHITGTGGSTNGFDTTETNNPSMYVVNEATQGYEAVTSTITVGGTAETDGTLKHGVGYLTLVRGDRSTNLTSNTATPSPTTLRTTGNVHVGDFLVDSSNLSTAMDGSSLLANPYQAPVDMQLALTLNIADFQPDAYHVYDPTIGDNGAFITVTFGTTPGDDVNTLSFPADDGMASESAANRYLQPGQSAFINTKAAGSAAPTFTFREAHKVVDQANNGTFFTGTTTQSRRNSSNDTKFIGVTLYETAAYANEEKPRDGTLIRFSENYTSSYDSSDATKVFNLDESISTIEDDTFLSINSRFTPADGDEVILEINNYKKSDYTFRINLSDFPETEAFLVDNYLGTQMLLNNNDETLVQFNVDSNNDSALSNRFKIIFTEAVLANDSFAASSFNVYPNPVTNKTLNLHFHDNLQEVTIDILNILGQEVYRKETTINDNKTSMDVSALSNGIYTVRVKQAENKMTTKVIISN